MSKIFGKINESADLSSEDKEIEALVDKYLPEVEKELKEIDDRRRITKDDKEMMYDWIADHIEDGDVDSEALMEYMFEKVLDDGLTDEEREREESDWWSEETADDDDKWDHSYDKVDDENEVDESETAEKGGGEDADGKDVKKTLKDVRKVLKEALKKVNKALVKSVAKSKKSEDKEEDEDLDAKDGDKADDGKKDVEDVGKKKADKAKKEEKGEKDVVDFDKIVGKDGVSKDADSKNGDIDDVFSDDGETDKEKHGLIDEGEGERTVSDVCQELSNLHKKSERLVEEMAECKGGEECQKVRRKIARNLKKVSNKIARLNSELRELCTGEDE